MTDNEFLLQDRIQKIQQVIGEYGEDNFYISFSGGKDSTILHYLVDMALPENHIPRVFIDTGIELNMIRDFVSDMKKDDERIVMIEPQVSVRKTLDQHGYPFKSKEHSKWVALYQRNGMGQSIHNYLGDYKKKQENRQTVPQHPEISVCGRVQAENFRQMLRIHEGAAA